MARQAPIQRRRTPPLKKVILEEIEPRIEDVRFPRGGCIFNPGPECEARFQSSEGYWWADRGICIVRCDHGINCKYHDNYTGK